MNTVLSRVGLLGLLLATLAVEAEAQRKNDKPKPTVTFARSWDAAVKEARILNVPIIIHVRGFYSEKCWGLHAAWLQNKRYIKYAAENTVDVISVQNLEKARKSRDRLAAAYKTKGPDGEEVEFMLQWPSLTYEDMIALHRSPAGKFNQTKTIPYTSMVNPHTLKEIQGWSSLPSLKSMTKVIDEVRRDLARTHGKGLSRKVIRNLDKAEAKARTIAATHDYAKALQTVERATRKSARWPDTLKERVAAIRKDLTTTAEKYLEELEILSITDRDKAKRVLTRLIPKLKGTGLQDKARAMLAQISG